jgi:divalent metal cation (Fe/Co/Zn/Cd) transporter
MTKAYQSIYVMFYRWSFKNFGQGKLPQFKSLFNVSFLLVVVLTNAMLLTKLMVKAQWLKLDMSAYVVILFGAVFFLLINHFILLNNRMFKQLNTRLATISVHNKNLFSVVLLVNVLFACGLCFIR